MSLERIAAGVVLAAGVLFAPGARAQAPQILLPLPAAAASAPATPADVRARGKPVRFNAAAMFSLPRRAPAELTLPNGTRHAYELELVRDHGGGIRSWIGRHRDLGTLHRAVATSGPEGTFAMFSTPQGEFRLVPGDGHDVLIDMQAEARNIPPGASLGDDARVLPPAAKMRPERHAARAFTPREGVDSLALTKAAPSPSYEVDLMIVYTRGLARNLQQGLTTRLYFLVERVNAMLADSDVALRMRLVNAMMVDYPDSTPSFRALDEITPKTFGFNQAAFGNVEAQREASGADAVLLWLDGPDFSWLGGGGWLGANPPFPNSMYSTVTGCVRGCEWIMMHEIGHNLGLNHDHATLAWQAGGTPDYFVGPFRHSAGYAFCTSGALTCNPELRNGTAGSCSSQPECSASSGGEFSDLMSYFTGSTRKNERFSNPNVTCIGFSGATGPCGTPEGAARPANAALSLNTMREAISAVKPTRVADPPPGAFQLDASAYATLESAGGLTVRVRRIGGATGLAQVGYRTREGIARAGLDFEPVSGTLTWADGDAADKTFTIPIVDDGAREPPENFFVELHTPGGTAGTFIGFPAEAVVHVAGEWPPASTIPPGFLTPDGSSAPWEVASDFAFEGSLSLRSAAVYAGAGTATSDVSFTGQLAAGTISYPFRTSSHELPLSGLQLLVDGSVQASGGGVRDWRVAAVPVAAGTHTLRWRFFNNTSSACRDNPSLGAGCADRAWIDGPAIPRVMPAASVVIASTPNPSLEGQAVTMTAAVSGGAGAPGGVVTFRDGALAIPGCRHSPVQADGRAHCMVSALPPGARAISAVHSGDLTYAAGATALLTQQVNRMATPQHALTVAKSGNGAGSVTSSPAGIDCGATCTFAFDAGTVVTLTATPGNGSLFAGWSGSCSGTGPCSVTLNAAASVGAAFEPVPPPDPPRLGNLSTRMQVLTGNDVMIGGFVIGGAGHKTVVVRARGPSLLPFGIANALANPQLQLVRSSDQATLATNDDWSGAPNAAEIQASGFAPSDAREAAILMTLPPGAYTAIVTGVGGATGVGIVEIFEVDALATPLVNISTRGRVLTGNDVMIGGFVIQGSGPRTVVVRARGPSLVPFGITNALANPQLQLVRSSDQSTLATNDDWRSAPNAAQVASSGFAPSNDLEAAILVTLVPGAYTAIVTGAGGTTGVGIVEVFAAP